MFNWTWRDKSCNHIVVSGLRVISIIIAKHLNKCLAFDPNNSMKRFFKRIYRQGFWGTRAKQVDFFKRFCGLLASSDDTCVLTMLSALKSIFTVVEENHHALRYSPFPNLLKFSMVMTHFINKSIESVA